MSYCELLRADDGSMVKQAGLTRTGHLLEMSFVAKFSLSKGEKSFSDLSEKAESKAIGNCTEISGGCKDYLARWIATPRV